MLKVSWYDLDPFFVESFILNFLKIMEQIHPGELNKNIERLEEWGYFDLLKKFHETEE